MKNYFISKSKRLRGTPFTSRIEKQGVTAYTIYNHMLLPTRFSDTLEQAYHHLKEHVQVWDVSVQRQTEINGKDSSKLVQLMTCRDLSKAKVGRCYYAPIIDHKAKLISDPVILKLAEDRWWISLSDSDFELFAKGLAIGLNYDVNIFEAKVDIFSVQGPKSFNLMKKVLGPKITELKFFGFDYFEFAGFKHLIARSGWSKQSGFEVYMENEQAGLALYDKLFEIGEEFNLKPGCPNLIERIESTLLSYGNDIDIGDNPLECGFDKYVNLDSNIEFLGKEELKKVKAEGIQKKLMGVKINAKEIAVTGSMNMYDTSNNLIGELRSASFNPMFNQVIGIAMVNKPYFKASQEFKVDINGKSCIGKLCDLPFI
ncbi:MAG: dimethylsulfoniopropionate demethylase [Candidatus Pelagibacter sp. TMED118]|nr:MAG: dimethylsulfoniopropionate demethylase [Candidatus Pelagibacter sp. TMED118]|tara:strand:- start:6642 stop:7754 length:1113 start_codon:yes stop_codon:yes gene_type:complete